MKNLILIALLALMPTIAFARNETKFVGEEDVTVNATTGGLYTVGHIGYLNIFAHEKIYFTIDPDGVTPNTSSKFIEAGGNANTETFYVASDTIGLLADSGTVSVNFTITKKPH